MTEVEEKEYYSFESKDIESVDVIWSEDGYKQIKVDLKNGESYMVESDS